MIAQRTGLGQLFIDNATILAGRYTGGPAKVSVVSSAFFGTISGSSVANTVSTGALTIPNMKRLGYPGHFAGGVEAASSAGGQITPPIMGAAAFIMAEFLEVPYTTIVIAAIFPAILHYVGVFAVVHLMARKLNLKGLAKEQLPQLKAVWAEGWANIVPLIGLLVVLFTGYTPFMSAFCGISLAVIAGMSRMKQPPTLIYAAAFLAFVLWKFSDGGFDLTMTAILCGLSVIATLNPQKRIEVPEMLQAVELGVKVLAGRGCCGCCCRHRGGCDQHDRYRVPHRVHGDAGRRQSGVGSVQHDLVRQLPAICDGRPAIVHLTGLHRRRLHSDGCGHTNHSAVYHAGIGSAACLGPTGRSTNRQPSVRALLWRGVRDYAAGLYVSLCGGGHCQLEPIPNRIIGLYAWAG